MKNLKYILRLLLCGFLILPMIGCISSKYVVSNKYLLNAKTLPEKKTAQNNCYLSVSHVSAIPPYDQLDFLYRISTNQYVTDYYNSFLVSPTEQFEPVFSNHLRVLGNFGLDVAGSSVSQNKLQVQITEFYADYRNRARPKAVIAVRLILNKFTGDKNIILLDTVLRASVALKEKNTYSLLSAWNEGLRSILRRVVRDLNSISKSPEFSAGCNKK